MMVGMTATNVPGVTPSTEPGVIDLGPPSNRKLLFDGEELPSSPNFGFVVHEVASTPANIRVWAWCKVVEGVPGYQDISFTLSDGMTPTDALLHGPLKLGAVITRVWC